MNKLRIASFSSLIALFTSILLFSVLTMTSCKKEVSDKKPIGPEFNMDKFETELKNSFLPSGAIGWTYVIGQNGLYARGGGFGKARNKVDGDLNMTIHKKINIASVSKFLTAIAVMQLLERRGLTKDDPITPWLPSNWNKGPGVVSLKFGELLGQRSGLSSVNTQFSRTLSFTGLRKMIDTGVIKTKDYTYLNANFALFRVLIPSLWKGLNDAPVMLMLDSATTEKNYIRYMDEHVFAPIGLNAITCEPEARSVSTLYYKVGDGENINGLDYGSWTFMAGGGGYYMSTFELSTVLAYYQHTNILLSNNSRTIMKENRYGMDRQDGAYEQHGVYYGKNGSISNNGQGTYEQVVMFPNGIEVVVMFNTQGMVFAGGETFISRAIYDAYNKSWD